MLIQVTIYHVQHNVIEKKGLQASWHMPGIAQRSHDLVLHNNSAQAICKRQRTTISAWLHNRRKIFCIFRRHFPVLKLFFCSNYQTVEYFLSTWSESKLILAFFEYVHGSISGADLGGARAPPLKIYKPIHEFESHFGQFSFSFFALVTGLIPPEVNFLFLFFFVVIIEL